ncbi:hypothetical protein DUNSADRAFT_14991 [Dunaliella salina]|uniref:Uracil-DNA glycosylase-like domain-containing protein n=1 Tax=Dunaliella salina TaxID=3046 RepID=A0ABQ7H292_DUNSA|nr:hypothetical protein DUNSADRAFT_14991 [Dunaliella salina]|eukprot:KAF5840967.1 hypothetical protein DUNSADRAFT_14991 [Dunaliella salina]
MVIYRLSHQHENMASNPFEGFSFCQNTSVGPKSGLTPSPSPSHKQPRAHHPAAESIPDSTPQKKRRGNPEYKGNGSGDQGLAQCLARETELKQRLGGGLGEKLGGGSFPLRLIIVGHNPSEATWAASHVYAHKSNHMWRLLIQTGIAPPGTTGPEADDTMPHSVGVVSAGMTTLHHTVREW